jgi:antitoxin component of MazEF toxin-antitoxin module
MHQRLRKVGNSFIVTIPRDEVTRLNLREGQLLDVTVEPLETVPAMDAEVRTAFEESWARNEAAFRYLADR